MIAWLAVPAAFAQDTGIPQEFPLDVQRFRPTIDPYGYAVTESAATLGHLQVGAGVWGDYSDGSLVLEHQGERVFGPPPESPDAILDQRSVFDFQLGLGLVGRLSLVAEVPVVVWQQGFEPAAAESPVPTVDLEPAGLSDVRVTPKVVAVPLTEDLPVGLAFQSTLTIPTGSRRSFLGEGEVTVQPMAIFEVASDSVRDGAYLARGAVNLGARVKTADRFRSQSFGSEFVYRLALSARPAKVFEMGGDLQGQVGGLQVSQAPTEIFPWVRFHGAQLAAFTAGAGFGVNSGLGSPDFRLYGGFTIAPSFDPMTLDRDHDGIPNKFDACINIPEDLDQFEDDDGCPEDDNDQDGLLDPVDRCPNDPEDPDGFQDGDGCPDPDNDRDGIPDSGDACRDVPEDPDGFEDLDGCPDLDNDRDGIPDLAPDACPNAPETVNGFQDQDGCPDAEPFVDTDGDGLEDKRDRCPYEPEDVDRFQDEDGCPEPDNDLDGVLDVVDQCPFDPETKNGYQEEDGCPDTAPQRVIVQKEKIVITEKVFFETGKAIIRDISFELLDEVAKVINENPRITRIQVEGHTDSDGSDSYNLKLSQSRAESVVAFLVAAGVDPARLVAKGFGESLPIDTNGHTEGKAKNRRVEFTILEQDP